MQDFHKFENTMEALDACTALVESKLGKGLKQFLKSTVVEKGVQDQLAVADAKLGNVIKEKLGISCVCNQQVVTRLVSFLSFRSWNSTVASEANLALFLLKLLLKTLTLCLLVLHTAILGTKSSSALRRLIQ